MNGLGWGRLGWKWKWKGSSNNNLIFISSKCHLSWGGEDEEESVLENIRKSLQIRSIMQQFEISKFAFVSLRGCIRQTAEIRFSFNIYTSLYLKFYSNPSHYRRKIFRISEHQFKCENRDKNRHVLNVRSPRVSKCKIID